MKSNIISAEDLFDCGLVKPSAGVQDLRDQDLIKHVSRAGAQDLFDEGLISPSQSLVYDEDLFDGSLIKPHESLLDVQDLMDKGMIK